MKFAKSKKTLALDYYSKIRIIILVIHSVSETWQFTLPILSQDPKPHYEIITLNLQIR